MQKALQVELDKFQQQMSNIQSDQKRRQLNAEQTE